MNVIIETDRLLLRTFTLDDAQLIYNLNLDPEVIRYTLDPIKDLDHAKQVLEQVILPQYALYNHGRWAAHIKSPIDPIANEFIGWCGLKNRPLARPSGGELNEIDLGYRFIRSAWGKGYATEAAAACIKYGFEKLNLLRIVGRALPGNLASMRVLEKCGMKYIGEEIVEGLLHKTYDIYNPLIRE
ncbi:MAG: GNAT family N-acetyltransferase [Sphingobacteriales bacterium]|nr:GNAT family N-acetyltransferase [Sphingobacteriales bacterium]